MGFSRVLEVFSFGCLGDFSVFWCVFGVDFVGVGCFPRVVGWCPTMLLNAGATMAQLGLCKQRCQGRSIEQNCMSFF